MASRCENCAVRSNTFCSVGDAEANRELQRISHLRRFKAGETVIGEGEPAGVLGNVVSGVLKLVKTMSDGRQQIVGILLPSDMFGRVFSGESHFSIEAATDVTLCCFERPAFEKLLRAHRDIEHELLLSVLEELDAARDWMFLLGCQTVLERVATLLIILHLRTGANLAQPRHSASRDCVTVPVSRRDVATYLGTTVESISRAIQHLSRSGIIRILDPQHFEVLNRKALLEISGRDEFAADYVEATPPARAGVFGGGMEKPLQLAKS
jgi:CRP/FNR family transcriptional regulator